ncbi:MAG: hypothetical protein CMN30_02730 [Sandaracinus sp.]|nr:hypothetical protein [Sandaracinus sp.]|tara:strand:+ start:2484 stop:3380 length:897 start_codon:yes stop_codon:yes gene_type:complete
MLAVLSYLALAMVAAGLFLVAFILGRNPPAEAPELGLRGLKRTRAIAEGGLFAKTEPMVRHVAGWMRGVPLPQLRARVQQELHHAGEWLGLDANDFLALTLLSTLGMIGIGAVAVSMLDLPVILMIVLGLLGMVLPWTRIQGVGAARKKEINRALPGAIDLAALCMGAGLDFPGALRQIVDKSASRDAAIVEEVGRILQELDLGHTRRKALEGFAERVPTEAVRDFVGTVVQAEAKGTPLSEVLVIQARMLRMRRSVAAEEAAAKAGLMMMGPLMLMFVCIIMLLMGPFMVQFTSSGF